MLLRALLLLPVIALGLRLFGLKHVQRALARCTRSRANSPGTPIPMAVQARAAAEMVNAAARVGFYSASCLERSLALSWLLRRRGVDCELRIGVRKTAGRFEAHAWVEHQAAVVMEQAEGDWIWKAFPRLEIDK